MVLLPSSTQCKNLTSPLRLASARLASSYLSLCVLTQGEQGYAERCAELLDPTGCEWRGRIYEGLSMA